MKLLLIVLSVGSFLLHQGVSGADTVRVSVMEGDSVTLNTGVQTNQQEKIKWYFNSTRIAQINGDLSKSCTDVQCNEGTEKFTDRLKLDHQTGSLTIMNIRKTHSGYYELQINRSVKIFEVSVHDGERKEVKKKEGESVTLDSGVINNASDVRMWYCNETLIAEFTRDQNKTCTDVQCKKKFGDRLNLDPQTGSLNITNTTTEDSGEYRLSKHISISISISGRRRRSISSSSGSSSYAKRFDVTVTDEVSVMEGDSVTLNSGVHTNQQDNITWDYDNTCIAQINRDQSKICTDVQCKGGDERFRDRLKLDHQTGSLTIMNIRNTHAGYYELQTNNDEKTFKVFVHGAKREAVTKKEGESVTLDSGVINNASDVMMWYFNDILIAEFTRDQNKTCTDVQCKKKFGDRLNLDPQTGSLNITNTTTEDSGEYRLSKHISISISISGRRRRSISSSSGSSSYAKRFDVTVTGLSNGAVAGIVVGVLLGCAAAAAAGVIYYRHRCSRKAGKEQPRSPEEIPINVDVKEQPRAPEEIPMNE